MLDARLKVLARLCFKDLEREYLNSKRRLLQFFVFIKNPFELCLG